MTRRHLRLGEGLVIGPGVEIAGGGVEAALWGNWTGGIEYLYLSTGDFNTQGFVVAPGSLLAAAGVPVGSTVTETRSINNNILRARINYRF